MTIRAIHMVNLRQSHALEWIAMMKVTGDDPPSSYAGARIEESFGPARRVERWFQDSDLRPDLVSEHRGSARYVLEFVSPGRARLPFIVDDTGRFPDFHGGYGFDDMACLDWFTDAALRRGIRWYFEQRYRQDGRQIARFHVLRTLWRGEIEVQKRPA